MTDPTPAAAPAPAAPVEKLAGTPPPEAKAKPPVAKAPEPEPTEEYEIDGKKVQLTKTQARTAIQKAAAADKRLQEAAEKRKETEALAKLFEEDPEAALRKLGKDPEKLFGAHLEKKAKQALMTPEQIAAEKTQKELDDLRAKDAATQKEKTEAAQKAADAKTAEMLEVDLVTAADKYNLDRDPDVLDGMCAIGIEFLDDYGIRLSPDQLAQEYLRREDEGISKRDAKKLSKLEGKKLLAYLGEANLAKVKAALAAADAESLNAIPPPQVKPRVQVKAHTREVKGHIRETDFDKKFGL